MSTDRAQPAIAGCDGVGARSWARPCASSSPKRCVTRAGSNGFDWMSTASWMCRRSADAAPSADHSEQTPPSGTITRLGAQLARVDAGVHGPGAAVGEDHEVARVVALLHRHLADEVGHLVLDHAGGARGRLDQAQAEPRGEGLEAPARPRHVELQPPAQEVSGSR